MGISVPTTPGGGTTNVLQVARVVATTNQVRSGEHTIDGVATSAGNRVLLVGQSDAAENGLWVVVETPYTWTRPSDYATGATIQPNVVVPISEGTADGDTRWQITDDGAVTVDTDPTTWGKTNLGLVAVVDDVNPALGGNLDLNNKSVTGTGTWQGSVIASAYLDGDTAHLTGTQTFTGVKTFDAGLSFDSSPADETCSGVTASFQAGEALNRGDVVYYKPVDSKMWKAVATVAATSRAVAMAAEDISPDGTGLFLLKGFAKDAATFPTFIAGDVIYTDGGTGGPPTKTAPSTAGDFVQVIGWAIDADTVYFDPDSTVIEVA